jgi:hypothetical protein
MAWQIVSSALVGLALVLAVAVHAYARVRIERERTLQKLIDRGLTGDELVRAAGFGHRRQSDLRRGLLLIGVGLAWGGVTYFIGGTAWRMGVAPVAIGLVYVVLWALDGRPR